MAFYLRLALGLASFAGVQVAVLAGGDYNRGQGLYQNLCVACHSIAYNGVGPAHKNLFGRKAGSMPDYGYSTALGSAGIVWDAATLDRWLLNPEKFIPGQKMGFMVPSAQDRADLIAYLKGATASPPTQP